MILLSLFYLICVIHILVDSNGFFQLEFVYDYILASFQTSTVKEKKEKKEKEWLKKINHCCKYKKIGR
ncbi:hypothetical protein AAHE18_19G260400 [Arachis hypogaea]